MRSWGWAIVQRDCSPPEEGRYGDREGPLEGGGRDQMHQRLSAKHKGSEMEQLSNTLISDVWPWELWEDEFLPFVI